MRNLFRHKGGATAVEFAIVAPVFLFMIIGIMACGLAIWSRNVINDVATEAARCIAVGNTDCTVAAANCVDSVAVCYVIRLASDRGLGGLAAAGISIETAATIGAASFTRVTINHVFEVAGYTMNLSATESFPND